MIGFALSRFGFAGLLALLCTLIGRSALRRLRFPSRLERLVFEFSAGCGAFGLLAFALIACRVFTVPVLLGAALLASAPALLELARRSFSLVPNLRALAAKRRALAAIALVLPAVPIVALALYPPAAWDATMYHLPIAKAYAEQGALLGISDVRVAFFPQLGEMLDAAALLLFDDVTAQLLQAAMLIAVAMSAFCLARRLAGTLAGVWAALLWLSAPLALSTGTAAMTDVQTALFSFLGVVAYLHWREAKSSGWAVLSGALLGFAAATKYLGLIPLAIIGCLFLGEALRKREAKSLTFFTLSAFLVSIPWYFRTFLLTGNPTYPFLTSLWGGGHGPFSAAEVVAYRQALVVWPSELLGGDPRTRPIRRLLYLFSPFRGGSPLSLVLLPALALLPVAVARNRATRVPAAVAAIYGLAWAVSFPDSRYFLPALPLLAAVTAAGMREAFDRYFRTGRAATKTAAAAISTILLLPSLGYSIDRLIARGAVPADPAERTRYLSRIDGYAAVDFLNSTRGSDYVLYALYAERLVYYCRGRWEGDWFGRYRYEDVAAHLASPESLARELRRAGAGYFLVDEKRFFEIHGKTFPIVEGSGLRLIYRDPTSKLFEVEPAFR